MMGLENGEAGELADGRGRFLGERSEEVVEAIAAE